MKCTALRIRDVYPGSPICIFSHPGSTIEQVQKGEEKINQMSYLFILISQKMWAGYGIRDPGSEIRDPEKTYPGSRGQRSTEMGSWIPDPDLQHCTSATELLQIYHGTITIYAPIIYIGPRA
jgi:hypothetical protein